MTPTDPNNSKYYKKILWVVFANKDFLKMEVFAFTEFESRAVFINEFQ
jgi:hypothetical protein